MSDLAEVLVILGAAFIVGIALPAFVAATCRADVALEAKPKKLLSLTVDAAPDDVFRSILRYSVTSPYSLDIVDETTRTIVFSEAGTSTDWGFFHAVYVSTDGAHTLIETGSVPKYSSIRWIVDRKRESFHNRIKAVLISA